jgi:hypothetical protein
MFAKTLIAAAAVAVSASGASAHGPSTSQYFSQHHAKAFSQAWKAPGVQIGQSSFFFNFGGRKVCAPVYAEKWDWHPWKGWVAKTVKIGEECDWQPYGLRFKW